MPATMRAGFVQSPYQVEVREVPVPEVKEDWALVKVEACGICGTDMHFARDTAKAWQSFGHEVAGVVVAAGRGVHNAKEGDRVVLESGSYNPFSDLSRNGRVDLDSTAPNIFLNEKNGTMGFADYILAPKESLVHYDGLTPEVACLAEPLGVAIDVTYVTDVHLGNEVLVLGLGPIGLMAIPLVKMQGAGRIYAVNRSGGKREQVARALGADEVLLTGDQPLTDLPFRKGGLDRTLVTADPKVLPGVIPVMNYGGYISFIGINWQDGEISFNANDFHFKKLQLRASHAAPALYFPLALQLLKDRKVDGELLVSHVMSLDDLAAGIALVRDQRDAVI
ncbi:MAG: alcohol dehydrogenase catalytic domain-containing protein, partial [Anaerolineae bacterium]|nr:alcohol dehydrogenase catalytic domain-containing protein [Anaerolineae bacterium]